MLAGTTRRTLWTLGSNGLALLLSACATAVDRPALPAESEERAGRARLSGLVAAWDGRALRPVAGARVTAPDGVVGDTDAAGRYALATDAVGRIALSVSHPAHRPVLRQLVATPGGHTPDVNTVLAPTAYVLRQTAFDATIAGVVAAPRGSALADAEVRLACGRAAAGAGASATVRTDARGFFTAALPNVVPGDAPARLAYAAVGRTLGGVSVETPPGLEAELAEPRVVLAVQADVFAPPGPPTIQGLGFVLPGQEATIAVPGLSARADEFHLEITSGGERFEVLPLAVAGGLVRFRVPLSLPASEFRARVVPFGRPERASATSPAFLASYTAEELGRDVGLALGPPAVDLTTQASGVNRERFVPGDRARWAFTLTNASTVVQPQLELTGRVPVGTAFVTATAGGQPVPFEGPDGTGLWRVRELTVPAAGSLPVELVFGSNTNAANGLAFGPRELALAMPSLGLTWPGSAPELPAITVEGIDPAGFALTKTIVDDATPGNGRANVVLVLTPVGSLGGAAFKLSDGTRTEPASTATAASFTGTVTLPPAGVELGLQTDDRLDLRVDGAGTVSVRAFGPGYDAETLIGQINTTAGLSGLITASRRDGYLYLERTLQGAGRTLEVMSSSTANMLARTGLAPGRRASGYQADVTGIRAVQPGGTAWTAIVTSNTWTGASGLAAVAITLRPPAAYQPGDGPAAPITITYGVRKLNDEPAVVGGGSGSSFGARVTSYNQQSPYTDVAQDRALGRTVADPPAQAGL